MVFIFHKKNIFFQDNLIRIGFSISLFFIVASLLSLYFLIAPQAEPLALRYSIYFGIDLIGPWWSIFFLPLVGLLVFIVNFSLAHSLFLKSRTLSNFLVIGCSTFQFFLLIITLLIILLNK